MTARASASSSTGLTVTSETGFQLSDHRYTAAGTANARDGLAAADTRRTHNNATTPSDTVPGTGNSEQVVRARWGVRIVGEGVGRAVE